MSKGEATRQVIVDKAMRLASTIGLEGLSIGGLAGELGLSKSGLFAHFRSKEALQRMVLEAAAEHFISAVVRPAIAKPRGLPRVRALFERWIAWGNDDGLPGGCIFVTAATELDDRPGPLRALLVESQRDWIQTLARAAQIAVDEGHFRADLDAQQFAFELYAIMLGSHHHHRLLRDPKTTKRARTAFERLLEDAQA